MNSSPFRRFISTAEPPELGPGPRANIQPLSALNRQLDAALEEAGFTGTRGELIRATVQLWHDHHDAVHVIAQAIESQDGSYVHAILHRREPDYGNAKYWFRRVGQHPCFGELAVRASALLKGSGNSALGERLLPRGKWDSFAFVDACETVAGRAASDVQSRLLREIQQAEFEVLLEYLTREI